MNLIVFFRNKAVADGAVSFYLDRCVAVRIATSTFGIECLTSFNEEDLEHIARSDKAIIRPSGRIVLPDYFDVILKKVSWCCARVIIPYVLTCRVLNTILQGTN